MCWLLQCKSVHNRLLHVKLMYALKEAAGRSDWQGTFMLY